MRAVLAALSLVLCLEGWGGLTAIARDNGQWDDTATSADVKEWYGALMQPDNPGGSCCGEADAYWADSFEVDGDRYVAIITDERPDSPLRRPHIAPGTKIVVPNNKLKFDQGNPTGHGVIFIGQDFDDIEGVLLPHVYCYVAPGGV